MAGSRRRRVRPGAAVPLRDAVGRDAIHRLETTPAIRLPLRPATAPKSAGCRSGRARAHRRPARPIPACDSVGSHTNRLQRTNRWPRGRRWSTRRAPAPRRPCPSRSVTTPCRSTPRCGRGNAADRGEVTAHHQVAIGQDCQRVRDATGAHAGAQRGPGGAVPSRHAHCRRCAWQAEGASCDEIPVRQANDGRGGPFKPGRAEPRSNRCAARCVRGGVTDASEQAADDEVSVRRRGARGDPVVDARRERSPRTAVPTCRAQHRQVPAAWKRPTGDDLAVRKRHQGTDRDVVDKRCHAVAHGSPCRTIPACHVVRPACPPALLKRAADEHAAVGGNEKAVGFAVALVADAGAERATRSRRPDRERRLPAPVVKVPPANRSPFVASARDETRWYGVASPAPSADQAVPFQRATLAAATPPATSKEPPATTSPFGSRTRLATSPYTEDGLLLRSRAQRRPTAAVPARDLRDGEPTAGRESAAGEDVTVGHREQDVHRVVQTRAERRPELPFQRATPWIGRPFTVWK